LRFDKAVPFRGGLAYFPSRSGFFFLSPSGKRRTVAATFVFMNWTELLLRAIAAITMMSVVLGMANLSVLLERKASAWIQGRVGPNRTNIPFVAMIPVIGPLLGKLGLIQSAADGGKLLLKEDPVPGHVNKPYYFLAPICALAPALIVLVMLPFGMLPNGSPLALCSVDTGFLFMFAVSSLGVYGIILAGWAANSKYPFMGAVRGSAQLISYELAMGLSVIPIVLAVAVPGSTESALNIANIVGHQTAGVWHIISHPLSAFLFLVAVFAETNRAPFYMPESETDLVGGFHTEYGSFKFGLFFVAEYGHMIVGSSLFILFFLGGWSLSPVLDAKLMSVLHLAGTDALLNGFLLTAIGVGVFFAKLAAMLFFFVWVRWTLPRFRYDQVMQLGWGKLLPLAIVNLLVYVAWYGFEAVL
jgi:NADH-quinone oxidoreductase subunit H